MGSFLDNFFFGRPDPVTNEPSGGLAQTPFAKFWGGVISTAAKTAPLPVTLPARAGLFGLEMVERGESYALARPFSTGLQALNIANPLYRNGLQADDFVKMWNASEYISPGRAGITNIGTQLGIIQAVAQNKIDQEWNEFSYLGDYDPYEMSPEEVERRWDESPLGTIGSTALDTAFVIIAGGKGVNAAARGMKRAAGLSTSIKSQKELTALRVDGEAGILWKASGGTEGKRTPIYKDIEDVANATDVNEILNSRLLMNVTRSGSFNRMELAEQWSRISDERLILDIALADRGDVTAIGRLFREAPDSVWALSDMNEVMRRQFAAGGQFVPDAQSARIYNQTFESAIERDEFWRSVKNTFMTTDPNDVRITAPSGSTITMQQGGTEQAAAAGGLISGVRIAAADTVPMGTTGLPVVRDAAAYAERWVKSTIGNARINRPNSWHEIPVGGNSGKSPTTRFLFWAGSRRPNNMIQFNSMRPDEIVDEMISYSRSSRALKNKEWTVTRRDVDGIPQNITMRDYEWRAEALARLSAAKATGDQALAKTTRDLETELITVVANKYRISTDKVDEISDGLRTKSDAYQAQAARDGYWIDHDSVRVVPDPVTRRQLPNSMVLMPLDEIDWALRQESSVRYATRGRATRAGIMAAEATLDTFYRFFRTNVLFTGKYVPKNSIAEPAVAAMLADASLLPEGNLLQVAGRVGENTARRTLQLRYGISDVMPYSAARKDRTQLEEIGYEYETAVRQLEEIDLRIEDLTSHSSPATQAKFLNVAEAERRAAYAQLKDVEARMGIDDPVWRSVDELPTYSQLRDRVQLIDDAINDPDFVARAQSKINSINARTTSRELGELEKAEIAQLERLVDLKVRASQDVAPSFPSAAREGNVVAGTSLAPLRFNPANASTTGERMAARDLTDMEKIHGGSVATLSRGEYAKVQTALEKSRTAEMEQLFPDLPKFVSSTDSIYKDTQKINPDWLRAYLARYYPDVKETDTIRLYRGLTSNDKPNVTGEQFFASGFQGGSYSHWTSNPAVAASFGQGSGRIAHIDVPMKDVIDSNYVTNNAGGFGGQSVANWDNIESAVFIDYTKVPQNIRSSFEIVSDINSAPLLRSFSDVGAGAPFYPAGYYFRHSAFEGKGNFVATNESVTSEVLNKYNITSRGLPKYVEGTAQENIDFIFPVRADGTRSVNPRVFDTEPLDAAGRGAANRAELVSSLHKLQDGEGVVLFRIVDPKAPATKKALDPEELLADLRNQLEEIRSSTLGVNPNAAKQKEMLQNKIAELDGARRRVTDSIATRNLSRERARERVLSGEDEITVRGPSGAEYRVPGVFSDEPGQFGSALRSDASADVTAYQTAAGGARTGMRWRQISAGKTINPFDPRYWDELAYVANRHVRGDDFANLFLQGKSQGEIITWLKTPAGRNYRKQMGWAQDDIYGETGIIRRTQDAVNAYFPNPQTRARLLEGGEVTPAELQKLMGDLPMEQLSPIYGTGLEFVGNPAARVNKWITNGSNTIWRNLAAKPESRFGRFPFMQREYRRQMEAQISLAEQQGLIITGSTLKSMQRTSRARALKEMENTFYNIRRMTGPIYAMRYLVGFPAASYNTAYRYGRLAYRSPGNANVQAQAWFNAINFMGVDKEGGKTENWKEVDSLVLGVPEEWNLPIDPKIKLKAESLYFGMQDGSYLPTITMPVSTFMVLKPDIEDWMKKEMPDVYETMFEYGTGTSPDFSIGPVPLDPLFGSYQRKLTKFARSFFTEIPDEDFARVVIQDFQYKLFQWANDGQVGPRPKVEDSANSARWYYGIGTAVSNLVPGTYFISPEGQYYREEWARIRSKYPEDFPTAQAEMIDLYGPGSFFMMRPTSVNRASMPPTAEGFQIFTQNEELLKVAREIDRDNPAPITELLFLDAQDYDPEDFSGAVYSWMGRNSLPGESEPILGRMAPQKIEEEVSISRSWALYNAAVAKRDALMMEYGYKQLRPDGDSDWLYNEWNDFYNNFTSNPEHRLWFSEKTKWDSGKTLRVLDFIDEVLSDSDWMSNRGKSITWRVISEYREELDNARRDYDLAESTEERKNVAESWDSYVRYWFLPQAGNFSNYYERYLAGRDINGKSLLEREMDIPRFPITGGGNQ